MVTALSTGRLKQVMIFKLHPVLKRVIKSVLYVCQCNDEKLIPFTKSRGVGAPKEEENTGKGILKLWIVITRRVGILAGSDWMKVELEVVDNERRRSVEHAIHLTVCRNDGGGIVLLFPCKRAGLQSPQSVAAAVYGHHATATPTTTLWLSSVCTASPGALRNCLHGISM